MTTLAAHITVNASWNAMQLLGIPADFSCTLSSLNTWPQLATYCTHYWSKDSEMSVSVVNLMTTFSVCAQTSMCLSRPGTASGRSLTPSKESITLSKTRLAFELIAVRYRPVYDPALTFLSSTGAQSAALMHLLPSDR